MPHNYATKEAEVKANYAFFVRGGEYSVFNALLAAADALVTGGNLTFAYLKNEVVRFGIDLASSLAQGLIRQMKHCISITSRSRTGRIRLSEKLTYLTSLFPTFRPAKFPDQLSMWMEGGNGFPGMPKTSLLELTTWFG
jgi:hypothetical protein